MKDLIETEFKISGSFMQLNQLLKVVGWAESGSDANGIIDAGKVKVNGRIETRRRNKLLPGYVVSFEKEVVQIL